MDNNKRYEQVARMSPNEVLTHELTHDGTNPRCPMCVRPPGVCEPCEIVVTDYGDYTTGEVLDIVQVDGMETPQHTCSEPDTCVCSCKKLGNTHAVKVIAVGKIVPEG